MHQPLTLDAQTLLLALNQSSGESITLTPRPATVPEIHQERAARELTDQSLAASTERYSGHSLLPITPIGQSRAEAIGYTYPEQMRAHSILAALHSGQPLPEHLGGSPDEHEQYETMTHLIEVRLVAVDDDAALSETFSNPRLTPLGRQCLASRLSPDDFVTQSSGGGSVTNNFGDRITMRDIHTTGPGQVGVGHNVTFNNDRQAQQLGALDALDVVLEQAETTPDNGDALTQARAASHALREKALTGVSDGVKEAVDELARKATTAIGFAALGGLQAVSQAFLSM